MIVEKYLDDVILIKQNLHEDRRGYFFESFNKTLLSEINTSSDFIQDNVSFSKEKNTIRGLHYQKSPFEQAKLVCLIKGSILDVFVDTRLGSKNFGKHNSVILDKPGSFLYIPKGYLHGFITLESDTCVGYKVDNFYNAECELGVKWNDPDLGINWKISEGEEILSEKDTNALSWQIFIKKLNENER